MPTTLWWRTIGARCSFVAAAATTTTTTPRANLIGHIVKSTLSLSSLCTAPVFHCHYPLIKVENNRPDTPPAPRDSVMATLNPRTQSGQLHLCGQHAPAQSDRSPTLALSLVSLSLALPLPLSLCLSISLPLFLSCAHRWSIWFKVAHFLWYMSR